MKFVISRMHYNEYDAILKTHPYFCKVQYVDGRFPDFTKIDNCDSSTDGSNGLIDSFENAELHTCSEGIIEKTNYQFQCAGDYDVMIILACDEYIVGDWKKFIDELESLVKENPDIKQFYLPFEILSGDSRPLTSKNRVFIDPSNWSVKNYHWRYYYKNVEGVALQSSTEPMIQSIKIIHDDRVRDPKRNELMKLYQDKGEGITG